MLRRSLFTIVALSLVAGASLWWFSQEKSAVNSEVVAGGNSSSEGDSLGLAMKTMHLTQGENGLELWRLKAEWATMRQEDGKIAITAPKLTYIMGSGKPDLFVVSEQGDVNQETQQLRFMGNVLVTQGNSTVRGDLLLYNGTARTMLFPQGANFAGDKFSGTAHSVIWRMGDQVIEGTGDVDFVLLSPSRPLGLK